VVFGQTKKLLGGRVRLILSGGAPLSPDTHELIKVCLCEKVIQGYGLTETTSCATVMHCKFYPTWEKHISYICNNSKKWVIISVNDMGNINSNGL
jgi:Long-chain acyl-CoA synthetases (AMP-forming)